ncbi:MAG TPA: hypothetical protein DCM28_20330 [Phycisphaerales bacterium]|nr:hypothetical protein [Phycisphaerales bacterium]HCD32104.1 hypothetical protein [Phycisphaerales bacterium]|tara:strand:+ start:1646 stop:1834 length:189 start_codon:yes stop_codon:yes gene_type:complete
MDQKPKTTPPTDGQKQTPSDESKQSRRQFVTRMAKRAAYVAPAVIALSANKSAFGSGGSGVS